MYLEHIGSLPLCAPPHECHAEVLTQAVQKDLGKALPFEVTASEINLGIYSLACLVSFRAILIECSAYGDRGES